MQENDKPANEKIVECISTAEDTNAESRLTCQQKKSRNLGTQSQNKQPNCCKGHVTPAANTAVKSNQRVAADSKQQPANPNGHNDP